MRNHFVRLPDACFIHLLSYLISPSNLSEFAKFLMIDKKFNLMVHCFVTQDVFNHYGLPFDHNGRNLSKRITVFQSATQQSTVPFSLLSLHSFYLHRSPKIILIGGLYDNRKCDILNPWSGRFHKKCSLAIKRNDDFEVVSCFPNHIMVFSGSDDSSLGTIEIFNLKLNRWFLLPPMPRPLIAMSVCITSFTSDSWFMINGKSNKKIVRSLLLSGGVDRQENYRSRDIYLIHLEDTESSATVINGDKSEIKPTISQCLRSFVIQEDEDPNLSSTYSVAQSILDSLKTACIWTQRKECVLLNGRSHHCSIMFKGNLWTAGGMVEGGSFASKDVEVFDYTIGAARLVPSMNVNRLQFRLLIVRDKLYAVGGDMNGAAHAMAGTIECFDEVQNSWIMVTVFPTPARRSRCAVAASGDRIYIFGGSDGPINHISWDYYDVVKKYWGSEMKMNILHDPGRSQYLHLLTSCEIAVLLSTDFNHIPGRLRGIKCAKAIAMDY